MLDLDNAKIIDMYNNGMTSKDIAIDLGVSQDTILKRLKKHGVKLRSGTTNYQINDNELISLYQSGLSCNQIGEKLKIPGTTVLKRLHKNGVNIRESSPKIKLPEKEIIFLYNAGVSSTNIAKTYGVSHGVILDRLRSNGVKIRESGSNILKTDDLEIARLYESGKSSTQIASVMSISYRTVLNRLMDMNIPIKHPSDYEFCYSNAENVIVEFIKSLGDFNVIRHDRTILLGHELDIFIPDAKLAIEFNGTYWHSDIYKSKLYHQKKTLLCLSAGIRLIHIWEHLWIQKQMIYKSIIANALSSRKAINLYARKCQVKTIKFADCKKFIDANHIQGSITATIYFGLYHNHELIMIMSFSKRKDIWEISRLCSDSKYRIVGGAKKLWAHFIKKFNPKTVFTFSDASIFSGNVYKELGFEYAGITAPGYVWVSNNEILSRQKCQKHKLLAQGFSGNSESEIMKSRGFHKIFDSGNHKFIWNNSSISYA